eukprot:TRINITY_DN40983_c0_g1_i1.p1 TRINITY_DN40983_c0_g1~~TRINITY_DN40983_c0_g1_i1.p1  ORF type:complete len:929 (-),score=207.15 TRINITY_DN40983_c0_g1_i1:53-2590(-)
MWVSSADCCIRFVGGKRRPGSDEEGWLSGMGGIRELEKHYDRTLEQPFQLFGVSQVPSMEQVCRSIEICANQHVFAQAALQASRAFEWLETHAMQAGIDDDERELRKLLSRYRAVPCQDERWVAWLHDEDESLEGAVSVFLPPARAPVAADSRAVLSSHLRRHHMLFQKLGMKELAWQSETVDAHLPSEQETVPAPVEYDEQLEGSQQEQHLRIAAAYIQCWLYHSAPEAYRLCDASRDALASKRIYACKELKVNGHAVHAHVDFEGVLLISDVAHGAGLQRALHLMLSHYLRLTHGVCGRAEALGIEVLIGLEDSERPGRAGQQALFRHQVRISDPSALALTWWLGVAPLPLEEFLQSRYPGTDRACEGRAVAGAAQPSGAADSAASGGQGSSVSLAVSLCARRGRDPEDEIKDRAGPHSRGNPKATEEVSLGSTPPCFREKAAEIADAVQAINEARRQAKQRDYGAQADIDGHKTALRGAVADLQKWMDSQCVTSSSSTSADAIGEGADAWAEWARRRAPGIDEAVEALEELQGRVNPPGLEACKSEALHAWNASPPTKDHRGWALQQAAAFEELMSSARACFADGQEQQMEQHMARCRQHVAELQAWAQGDYGAAVQRAVAQDAQEEEGDDLATAATEIQDLAASPLDADTDAVMNRLRGPLNRLHTWLEADARASTHGHAWSLTDVSSAHLLPEALAVVPEPLGLEEWQEREVAQWGEQWVYNWLSRKHGDSATVITWHNRGRETFLPFDISVELSSDRVEYYEVKSTITADKKLAQISDVQVMEAARRKDAYFLVRVFGAGTRSPQMLMVPNPSSQWQTQKNGTSGLELLVCFPGETARQ